MTRLSGVVGHPLLAFLCMPMCRYAPKSATTWGANSMFSSSICCLCFCVNDALDLLSLYVRWRRYWMCQLHLAALSVS